MEDYLNKLLQKAQDPKITNERRRQLLYKALHLLDAETTSVWWVLKINVKTWVHEKLFGTKWCD